MSGSGGGNILDALDEDEDAEALLAASDSLQSEDAKEQLSAALKVSDVLRSQIAAYPLETQLPEPSDAERRHLDALRPVWAAAFGDRARKEPSEPAPEELDEDSLSSAIDLGEVSIDGVEHIIRTLRHVGALPDGATRTLCDLRAGNGRLLVAAALLHPFASVAGLEPEAEKLEEAHAALARLQELAGTVGSERGALAGVVLEERDVCQEEEAGEAEGGVAWRAADVLLVNSPEFDEFSFTELASALLALPPGAVVASLLKRVPCPELVLVAQRALPTRWGDFALYIIQPPPPPLSY